MSLNTSLDFARNTQRLSKFIESNYGTRRTWSYRLLLSHTKSVNISLLTLFNPWSHIFTTYTISSTLWRCSFNPIAVGVPQGRILGPLFNILCTVDIPCISNTSSSNVSRQYCSSCCTFWLQWSYQNASRSCKMTTRQIC